MKKVAVNGRTLAIRPAEQRDADLLADLGARTFSDTYSSILPARDLDHYLREAFSTEQMLDDIANPEVLLFVGSISNTVCSYIKLEPTPPRKIVHGANPIELLRLYVLPRWKGMGIGGALLDVGLAAARDKGHKTCWLKVWEGNARATDFYKNRGFSLVGSEQYPVGSTSRSVALMVRSLE
ncbi:MAG: GNAT family N-acetyltransferase [Planctomycetota bacterium]|jgi:ribosomal protein S18 acetylase RimI-like enzyme